MRNFIKNLVDEMRVEKQRAEENSLAKSTSSNSYDVAEISSGTVRNNQLNIASKQQESSITPKFVRES